MAAVSHSGCLAKPQPGLLLAFDAASSGAKQCSTPDFGPKRACQHGLSAKISLHQLGRPSKCVALCPFWRQVNDGNVA